MQTEYVHSVSKISTLFAVCLVCCLGIALLLWKCVKSSSDQGVPNWTFFSYLFSLLVFGNPTCWFGVTILLLVLGNHTFVGFGEPYLLVLGKPTFMEMS